MKVKKKIWVLVGIIILIISGIIINNNVINKKYDIKDLINIDELSDEFMDNYFNEVSKLEVNEENDNILIVISAKKIENKYGASKIIEAPNNQYIIQFDNSDDKFKAIDELEKEKYVLSVEENQYYTIEEEDYSTIDTTYNSWGIHAMALDYAMDKLPSIDLLNDITVAVIDTGCEMSLLNKYYPGKNIEMYNVVENSTTVMTDENGHGTHVIGTIAEGTPANVKVMPVKVSRSKSFSNLYIVNAINYLVSNNKANVINMSFGGEYSESIKQAIDAALEKNIICVAAAGNDNSDAPHYPSGLDSTISISSVDSLLNKSTFSNYGSTVNFAAPGTSIKSIMSSSAELGSTSDGDADHETISGTSMATPHAAAAVAILKSLNKDLTLANVIELLKMNSKDLGTTGRDQYFGDGLISFDEVEFCDGSSRCDEYGVFLNENYSFKKIELNQLNLTDYNYYSITNLMASTFKITYFDNTTEIIPLWKLPDVEVLNYSPTASEEQTVTIKLETTTVNINVTNPTTFNSGWDYTISGANVYLTGYRNHGLGIGRLDIPETINGYTVVAIDENKMLSDKTDFNAYESLYIPTTFLRIGAEAFKNSKIKYVYGDGENIGVGDSAFENSALVLINIPLSDIGDKAFKDCKELFKVDISGLIYPGTPNYGHIDIGDYAFFGCEKLEQINKVKYNTVDIDELGKYAFYNCISLAKIDVTVPDIIKDYTFYNTRVLNNIDLLQVDSVGTYAFYDSGISTADLGLIDSVGKSAFENCRNLKEVKMTTGRIEEKAFWNSGVETVMLGQNIDYIAPDAFGYTPIKNDNGISEANKYKVIHNVGIIEVATKKLIVGFAGEGFIKLPESNEYTQIGDNAYLGNSNLESIVIPAQVNILGDKAFKDCNRLSNMYFLRNDSMVIGGEAFKRTDPTNASNIIFYVYKNSAMKQYALDNSLDYRFLVPDEVVVNNDKTRYGVGESVDMNSMSVKLIYHEKVDREEVLSQVTYNTDKNIFSDNIGYSVSIPGGRGSFISSDTYYTVITYNELGYRVDKNVEIEIIKATPSYTVPTGLTARTGQILSDITLPEHFEWMDGTQVISEVGEKIFKAKYIPEDTDNYAIVENIDIKINVSAGKTVVTPDISLGDKTYDGTTNIDKSTITISNLNSSEYTIVSAEAISCDIGNTTVKIKIKLTDAKFTDFTLDNGLQEKEYQVNLKIVGNIYTIIFNGNGGAGTMTNQEFVQGTSQKIKKNQFTKSGYVFKKWTTNSDGSGNSYNDEESITLTGNITLYAMWEVAVIYQTGVYSINESGSYIDNIPYNTPVDGYRNNFYIASGYRMDVDLNGRQYLFTGCITSIYQGDNLVRRFTNVVRGDINGDAAISALDYVMIKNHIMERDRINNEFELLAADVDKDGRISALDYVTIKNIIMGR